MNLRFNRIQTDNISVALFLIIILFVPQSSDFTRLYFALTLISVPLFLFRSKELYFDYLTLTGMGILLTHALFTLIRFIFIVDPNIRDYTELARLSLPVLLLIFRGSFKNVHLRTLFIIFAVYTGIDFIVSLLDFTGIDLFGIVSTITSIYVSDYHASVAIRFDGLSPGPAQHGVKMLVMFVFFYSRVFTSNRVALPLFFAIISAFPIFLSQSRTSIVAFAFVSLGMSIFYLIFGQKSAKKRSVPVLSLIVGGSVFFLTQFPDFLRRIFTLLGGLDSISAYQDRVEGYRELFDRAMEYPVFLVMGYGKEYLQTSVFDNEYLMMFLVYGPIITLIMLIGAFTFIGKFILKKNKTKYLYNTILFFLILSGLIIAYPAAFFLQPGILPILFIFVNLAYWESQSSKLAPNGKRMAKKF